MCRRATASAFAVLAWFKIRSTVWRGVAPAERRSSAIAERAFCPQCGSPLYLKYDHAGEIGLMVGTFDHPELLVPAYHYGVEARLPWIEVGHGLAHETSAQQLASSTSIQAAQRHLPR
jgi:hypothetical protein